MKLIVKMGTKVKKNIGILVFGILMCYCNKPNAQSIIINSKKVVNQDSLIKKNININNHDGEIQIQVVLDKLKKKGSLTNKEYECLCDFIINDSDESASENMGYLLFNYFKNDKKTTNEFNTFLKTKTIKFKETILPLFLNIMCIDLELEEYTYDKLIIDFSFFNHVPKIENSLKKCINN